MAGGVEARFVASMSELFPSHEAVVAQNALQPLQASGVLGQ